MKKRLLISILSITLLVASLFTVGCFNPSGGEPTREISTKLLTLMDETFSSAEYVITDESSKKSASSGGAMLCALSFSDPEYSNKLEDLTREFYGVEGGVPLTENNVKALKGEALASGSTFATMARALASVYGDAVFSECYFFQDVAFKMTGNDNEFTINGVFYDNNKYRSGFQMDLKKEKDDTYSYSYVEYTINTTFALLKISAFSKDGVLNAELQSSDLNIFPSYDTSYDKFTLEKITVANFNIQNYASIKYYRSSPATSKQVESVLKFSKETLGNSINTYDYLKSIKSTKTMTKDEVVEINSIVKDTYYVCPYYYETNKNYVRDEYVVPSNVTVIKTGSIPATKKILIHGNVTKIESRPFLQPEYLEEIVFTNPESNKLTQIGSFDSTTGEPSFILSMTKVKNFTLPSSVKKLELGTYVLNTEVESIDLSSYNPSFLTDSSQFTYKISGEDSKHQDYIKADYRNVAYVKLLIGGTSYYSYKELRYIHSLKMPTFNMGVGLKDVSHYYVKDANGIEYYSEAHRTVSDALKFSNITEDEFFRNNEYTLTYDCIGEIRFNEVNTIVSEDLLYSDISDKEDRRKDFDIELYSSGYDNMDCFSTVKYVYVNATDYFSAIEEEKHQGNRFGLDRLENDRVQIIIEGASGLSFDGFEFNEVYLKNGEKVKVSDLGIGDKFYAPNLEGNESIKKENGVNTYFVGWSYTKNGAVEVFPFEEISNNMQTLYPVFMPQDSALNFTMKDDGTYKVSFNKTGSGKILVIPSEHQGKKVTEFWYETTHNSRDIEVIVFAHGIELISDVAIRSVMPDYSIFPTTIKEVMGVSYDEDLSPRYGNGFYQPLGNNPFGMLVEIDDKDTDTLNIHEDTLIIGRDALSGSEVTNATIPSKVRSISLLAFAFSKIERVKIPSSVEYLGSCAFLDCDNLVSVEFENGLTQMGSQAFDGCDNLKTIKLPNSLKTLSSDIFDNCPSIEGNIYENGVYLGTNSNDYFALINIVDPCVETFKVHEDTELLSFDLEDGCDATKIYIGKRVREITVDLFLDFHNDFVVYYEGSQKDWNEITFTSYEFTSTWQDLQNNDRYKSYLEDAQIVYNA